MGKEKGKELWSIGKIGVMRGSGRTTTDQAKALKSTATVTNMKVTLRKEKRMAKVYTTGPTEKSMMANGAEV